MARVTCNASSPPVAACAYDGIGIRLYGLRYTADGDPSPVVRTHTAHRLAPFRPAARPHTRHKHRE